MNISVVVPVYEEEKALGLFIEQLSTVLEATPFQWELIFALDPSTDQSRAQILEAHQKNIRIKLLEFSRRIGQPAATLAGMQFAGGDAVVVMDVDLQDPPALIPAMISRWQDGYDVVYAQRTSRRGQNLFYRFLTWVAYFSIHHLAEGVDVPMNTGDFRLMSRRVVDHVVALKESHGFLRGMVASVGFRQTSVSYDRPPRAEGESHYNRFTGSLKIGFNGLFCYSNIPLRIALWLGLGLTAASTAGIGLWILWRLFWDKSGGHFAALLGVVLLLGGIQLTSIGILGEYIGRIYDEAKQRPRFIVSTKVGFDDD